MKRVSVFFWVFLSTFLLILVTIMASMDFSFGWVFYVMLAGQGVTLIMVYKVLTDRYSTQKTFKDFYEDHPIGDVPEY